MNLKKVLKLCTAIKGLKTDDRTRDTRNGTKPALFRSNSIQQHMPVDMANGLCMAILTEKGTPEMYLFFFRQHTEGGGTGSSGKEGLAC